MATLTDLHQRLKQQLRLAAPAIVQTQARAGLALAVGRIQRDGLVGKHYSPTPIPTFWWAKRALNAAGRAYVKQHRLGTWAGFRGAQGLPTAYVNLTYSGAMLRSLTVAPGPAAGSVFTARVVASDAENARKLEHSAERYGDVLALVPAEAAQVALVGRQALDKIIANGLKAA